MKDSLKKDFVDEKGNENTITIEGENIRLNTNKQYKLQHPNNNISKKNKPKGIFTSDIGIHSNGFAGIMGLATILSIAGIVIAYIFLKF